MVWSALACVWPTRATEAAPRRCAEWGLTGGVAVAVRSAVWTTSLIARVACLFEALGCLTLLVLAREAAAAPHPVPPGPSTLQKRLPPASTTVAAPPISPARTARPGGRIEPFGRWQPKLSSCQSRVGPEAVHADSCLAVLVDQRSSGVIRVSWLDGGSTQRLSRVLTFVGTMAPGGEPMACQQATCRLLKSFVLTLSSVSQSAFDRRGVAGGLPSAWSATGQCQVERERIRCEAKASSGEVWTALAQLP